MMVTSLVPHGATGAITVHFGTRVAAPRCATLFSLTLRQIAKWHGAGAARFSAAREEKWASGATLGDTWPCSGAEDAAARPLQRYAPRWWPERRVARAPIGAGGGAVLMTSREACGR